ncbi:cation:proton antiporter [uncultured Ornithinimicrobium sp.]|uniref:cation:proton antiporter domain-containing protein n=1 Tax=uncultured Ornithinimicrobium sp. TaxID=259307 RepID=UPI0025932F3D|nr:cation:proton antiporter [uncultured Ornithinimicrobium sp.]
MDWLAPTLAVLGLGGVVLALVSGPLERWVPVSEPLVALAVGVLVGPAALGLVRLEQELVDVLLLEGSRVLLAASVMAAALRYPWERLRGLLGPTALLLAVVMPLAALATAASALVLAVPISLALLVGACLAPTDPVLAAAVVNGEPAARTLPHRVRALLTLESGANDGLGVVLVAVLVAVVLPAQGVRHALGLVAWEVGAGVAIGALLGWLAGLGLSHADRHDDVGEGPELVYTLLLAVGVLGVARTAEAAGVLAVFVAGLTYNRFAGSSPREKQDAVDEGVNKYAVLPLVAVLGVVLPWETWVEWGWRAVVFAVLVLLVRRLPFLLALRRPLGLAPHQAGFMGFFGPMGISALFYLAHARHEGVDDPALWGAVTLVVAVSVVVFGVSGVPGRKTYARRYGHEGDREQQPVPSG